MKTVCSFCGNENDLSLGEIAGIRKMIVNVLEQEKFGIKDVAGAMKISLECSHCKRTYSAIIPPGALTAQDK